MPMLSYCGIDVSKDRLDVVVLPEDECFSTRNDAAGWTDLIEQLRSFSIAAIGVEASGGYECDACLDCSWHAGTPGQPVPIAAVRQGKRSPGEE